MGTSDVQIRSASTNDSAVIVLFVRAMLQDMASVGGHDVNPDETFWSGFRGMIVEAIQDADRLYLLAEASGTIVGYLEGKATSLPGHLGEQIAAAPCGCPEPADPPAPGEQTGIPHLALSAPPPQRGRAR